MNRARLNELRALVDDESMSWGDVADLQGAFEQIPADELPEPHEHAGFSDMLDELEKRLPPSIETDEFRAALEDLRTRFSDVVFAYWDRDEFTIEDEEGRVAVSDDEWATIHDDFASEVYSAVERSETIHYAVQAARDNP